MGTLQHQVKRRYRLIVLLVMGGLLFETGPNRPDGNEGERNAPESPVSYEDGNRRYKQNVKNQASNPDLERASDVVGNRSSRNAPFHVGDQEEVRDGIDRCEGYSPDF